MGDFKKGNFSIFVPKQKWEPSFDDQLFESDYFWSKLHLFLDYLKNFSGIIANVPVV